MSKGSNFLVSFSQKVTPFLSPFARRPALAPLVCSSAAFRAGRRDHITGGGHGSEMHGKFKETDRNAWKCMEMLEMRERAEWNGIVRKRLETEGECKELYGNARKYGN